MKRNIIIAISTFLVALIFLSAFSLLMHDERSPQISELAGADPDKIIIPDTGLSSCEICQERYNGCYSPNNLQISCDYLVLPDGNYCYFEAFRCGYYCLPCDYIQQ